MVYTLRGRGLAEAEIGSYVTDVLHARRPWRMSNAELGRALNRCRRRGMTVLSKGGKGERVFSR